MTEIQAGKHKGKISNYGFKLTQAGEPVLIIEFKIEDVLMTWQGYFNREAKTPGSRSAFEITMDSIAVCGFNFDPGVVKTNWNSIARGVTSGVLDTDREVQLTIEYEMSKEGKSYPRIKWINKIGGGLFVNLLAPEEAAQTFSNPEFMGALVAHAQKMKTKPVAPPPPPASSVDNIPF